MIGDFIEIKADCNSIRQRKLVWGFGVNDAWYKISHVSNGETTMCPYYKVWQSMLRRCYSTDWVNKHKTYKGCYVSPDWLMFSKFKEWMITQDWKGKQLDKDILKPNNKCYSPFFCVFVSGELNKILTDSGASRGDYHQGVYLNKKNNKFIAMISVHGKKKYLGSFQTVDEALSVYREAKYDYIMSIVSNQKDDRLINGLTNRALLIKQGKRA